MKRTSRENAGALVDRVVGLAHGLLGVGSYAAAIAGPWTKRPYGVALQADRDATDSASETVRCARSAWVRLEPPDGVVKGALCQMRMARQKRLPCLREKLVGLHSSNAAVKRLCNEAHEHGIRL